MPSWIVIDGGVAHKLYLGRRRSTRRTSRSSRAQIRSNHCHRFSDARLFLQLHTSSFADARRLLQLHTPSRHVRTRHTPVTSAHLPSLAVSERLRPPQFSASIDKCYQTHSSVPRSRASQAFGRYYSASWSTSNELGVFG